MTSTYSQATTITNDFAFPPQYNFPPFFTLQPNLTTRASQFSSWSHLIQSYCRYHRLFSLSLIDALSSPLFNNKTLGRQLSLPDATAIVKWMCSSEGGSRAEWVDKKKVAGSEEGGGKFWVYWRRPEEWASLIEGWVEETGQKGSVLTLYEITDGDGTMKEAFHGMDPELLQKSLQVSAKRGKAQIFGQEDRLGIKFF